MGKIAETYICVGESYTNNIRQGLCGGYRTVSNIVQWLFNRSKKDCFPEWTDKEIIDYIAKNYRKRFEKNSNKSGGWSIQKELFDVAED